MTTMGLRLAFCEGQFWEDSYDAWIDDSMDLDFTTAFVTLRWLYTHQSISMACFVLYAQFHLALIAQNER